MQFDFSIQKRKWLYAILAVIIGLFFAILSKAPCDLDVFIDGAQKFQAGANPYAGTYVRDLQYYYSPLFAMLLSFFTWVPVELLKFSWMVLIVISCIRISYLFRRYFPEIKPVRRAQLWVGIVLLLIIYFIILNVRATQMTVFMVWACFESIQLSSKNKSIYAGLLLGLFINFKLLLLPFFAYILYRGYFKTSFFTILAFLLYLILPSVLVGWQQNITLHSMWWNTINPANPEHIMELETGRYSLSALLPVYVQEKYFSIVLLFARLFFIVFTLFFLKLKPFKAPPSHLFQFRELSYLCLVIILIFPHQGSYSFFFLLPVFTYLTYFFLFHYKDLPSTLRLISLSFFILCLVLIFLGKDVVPHVFYDWTFKYHLMTWAIIGFVPLLALLEPEKIRD